MEIFWNRKTAILITIVVTIAATLFGVHRSLTKLSRELELLFYDGVFHDGYIEPGIESHLESHADASLRLATALLSYPELKDSAENVLERRRFLLDAVSIADKSLAFAGLSSHVYMMTNAAQSVTLTERDSEALSQYASTINGAETAIRKSSYNQTISVKWREQSVITGFLRIFIPVREPEPFSF